MSQSVVLYLCIFAGAFLALQVVISAGRQAAIQVKTVNDRLKRLEKNDSQKQVLEQIRKSRGLTKDGELYDVARKIRRLVTQSGLPLGSHNFFYIWAASPIVAGMIAYLVKGGWEWPLAATLAGTVLPIFILMKIAKRRQKKAVEQLPEALDVIIRALRAGYPVPVALGLVAREMPDPIGSEFGMATDEISYGAVVSTSIQRMTERVGHDDFGLFAAVVRLQEKTGGNLAELLHANAKTIRDRQKMRMKIKAASAEGRMSAMILNAAPLGMFLIIKTTAPEFYGDVSDNPIVTYALGGIVVWMAIGNLIMRRMINFRI